MLFGLLALQVGLIDQGALVAAFQAWTLNKEKPLAEILVSRGDLKAEDCSAVEALIAIHVQKHGGDTERSMASIPVSGSTLDQLAGVADSELQQTIIGMGRDIPQIQGDPNRTVTNYVGKSSNHGQRFRLLRPHAKGGLGAVFVALDDELHREVALKQILDQHADDPASRQRFVLEAEITGGLEHPGIVPVYGLGAYRDGRPFYAMRFIRGESLKEAIAAFHADNRLVNHPGERSLALRNLLRRFVDVCNAMEYAHSRGILHRDLKPSNIIVGRHGETLVVDWGLAKVIGQSDSTSGERTMRPASASGSSETLPGAAMGTPAFMSPEQARGDIEHLGPASDIYSLGGSLFCLLTGKPALENTNIFELLQAVQNGKIPSVQERDPRIDGALNAICRKAMALNPQDRYGSARALADDIERWMADEPVTAWHEPWSRRVLRWLTRHRVAVTAAAAAGLVALLGVSGIGLVQARANRAMVDKNLELQAANQREQERFDLAMDAIRIFHTGVSKDFLLKADEFKEQRAKLLGSARDFYQKLEGMLAGNTDIRSRRALGQAYYQLAKVVSQVGSRDETLQAYERAADVQRTLAQAPDANPALLEDYSETLRATGSTLEDLGRSDEGIVAFQQARSALEMIAPKDRQMPQQLLLAKVHRSLAFSLDRIGRRDEALSEIDTAQKITETLSTGADKTADLYREMVVICRTYGDLLEQSGQTAEAVAAYEQGLVLGKKAMDAFPDDVVLRSDTGVLNNFMGIHYVFAGQFRNSIQYFTSSRTLLSDQAAKYPAIGKAQENLAIALHNEGEILNRIGHTTDAIARASEARKIREALTLRDPGNVFLQHYLAGSDGNLGDAYAWQGSLPEAVAAYEQATRRYEQVVAKDPSTAEFRHWLAFYDSNHADVLMWQKQKSAALEKQLKILPIREQVIRDDPQLEYQLGLAQTHDRLDRLYDLLGQPEKAAEHRTLCFDLRKKLADENPTQIFCLVDYALSQARRGWMEHRTGQSREAVGSLQAAIAQLNRDIDSLDWTYALGTFHSLLSVVAGDPASGMTAEMAEAEAHTAVEILGKAAAAGYRPLARYQTDPDLNALRTRDDFQQLLHGLETKATPASARESTNRPEQ
ncbi:MAG: protein kinase [Planctomycetes bacterium]|nr:protein kinase [Planctomycetota bacterium]